MHNTTGLQHPETISIPLVGTSLYSADTHHGNIEIACTYEQGNLFYSVGPTRETALAIIHLKSRERFWIEKMKVNEPGRST